MSKIFKNIKLFNMLMLTVAGIVNAFGVTIFLTPVKLFDSGISGTSMLISQLTPPYISLSLLLLLLNLPIFLIGQKKEGVTFSIYSAYVVIIYAVFAFLITDVFPIDVTMASPLANTDLFLCAVFGGIISGCGSGLAVRAGGAIDGIDVLGVLFAKRIGLSLGTFLMIYNIALYVICGIVLGSWILPLYSIVTYFAGSKTIDFIVDGFDRSKAAFIVTTKSEEVCKALSETFETGLTIIDAKGFYSKSEKTVIYFVINRFQVGNMKNVVHSLDPKAYITINEVADIFMANQDEK